VREKLIPNPAFWEELFQKQLPHPLDSHPPLHERLEALGAKPDAGAAREITLEEAPSAFAQWLPGRDDLFAEVTQRAAQNIAKMRSAVAVSQADYETAAGKELLEQHFPEKKWPRRQTGVWLGTILMALVAVGLAVAAWFETVPAVKVFFGLIAVGLGLFAVRMTRVHHKAEFVLSAAGIFYSSWNRPLLFTDVARISARRACSAITLTFKLKTRQPACAALSIPGLPVKSVSFTLSSLKGKQLEIAQTICRYFARDLLPEGASQEE